MAQPISPLTGQPMQSDGGGLGLPWFDKAQALARGLLGYGNSSGSVVNDPVAQYPGYRDAGEVGGLLSNAVPLVKGLLGIGAATAPLVGYMSAATRGTQSVPSYMRQSGAIINAVPGEQMARFTKAEVKQTAEIMAERLREAGFSADVTHSGSAAGASSYVKVYDKETGRFLTKEIRVSDHSKGPFQSSLYQNVSGPDDVERIYQNSLNMMNDSRAMGKSKGFLKMEEDEAKAIQFRIASGRKKLAKGKSLTKSEEEALRDIGEIE